MPIQGQITFETLKQDKAFMAAPREKKMRYLSDVALPAMDADFAKAPIEKQQAYLNDVVLPQFDSVPVAPTPNPKPSQPLEEVSFGQGLMNLAGSAGGGVADFGRALVSPQTYQQIGADIGNAVQTDFSQTGAQTLYERPMALGLGAVKGVRDLGQGLASLPADIANAYMGQQVYEPSIQIPEVKSPLLDRYPVAGFVGEQLPYAFPLSRGVQVAKEVERANQLRAAASAIGEGAGIGFALDSHGGGLRGRAQNAAMGGTVPAALGVGAGALSRLRRPKVKTEVKGEFVDPNLQGVVSDVADDYSFYTAPQAVEKPLSKTAQNQTDFQNIEKQLNAALRHQDFHQQPATDFFRQYSIPFKKLPNKGSVLTYGVFVPGKGMMAFKHNAPLSSLGLPENTLAGMIQKSGGAETLYQDLGRLKPDESAFDGAPHELTEQMDKRGAEDFKRYSAEEDAYYAQLGDNALNAVKRIDEAQTVNELAQAIDYAYGDTFNSLDYEDHWALVAKKIEQAEKRMAGRATMEAQGVSNDVQTEFGKGQKPDPRTEGQGQTGERRGPEESPGNNRTLEEVPGKNTQGLSASEKQAAEAKAIKKERMKTEQGGFIRIGGAVKPKKQSSAFDAKNAGVDDLVGPTRKEVTVLERVQKTLKDNFIYMNKVKGKSFDVAGEVKSGDKLIALVDRLRAQMQKGYSDAEVKVRNSVELLKDEKGYSAQEKVKDVTQYLLYADYIRRAQDGMSVPGNLALPELQKGFTEIQKHIRQHPELRKAVLNVRGLLTELGDDLVKAGLIEGRRKQYFPHQVLEHLQDFYGLPTKVQTPNRGYSKKAQGSVKDIETDLLGAMDAHLKAIARHNAIDDFIKQVVDEYALPKWDVGDKLPEGFGEYQPRSGRQYFQAFQAPEKAVMQAAWELMMGNPDPQVQTSLKKIRTVLAVGGQRKTYAMPSEVIHYLNKLNEPKYLEGNLNIATKIVQAWKGLVTGSPLNPGIILFHFKNTIGDFENALKDDPALTKYIARAVVEMSQAKVGKPTKAFMSAEEWGTIGAGYYGAEMDLADDFNFRRRFSNKKLDKLKTRTPILNMGYKTYKNFERFIVKTGEAREDVLRYSKFLRDTDLGLEPWQAHIENGRVFVNYNHLTRFERDVLRDVLLPFYTFYKANAVNWFQALTFQRGKAMAARSYGLALVLPVAVAAWNQITDPETEDLLQSRKSKRYLANQLHIITPFKDNKGNKIVVVLPTASNQALQLMGLARAPYRAAKLIASVNEGKTTMTDALKEQFSKALQEDVFVPVGASEDLGLPRPLAEAVELINPFIKETAEQLFDYDLFMGRPITKGEDAAPGENLNSRLEHLGEIVAPPFQRLTEIFKRFQYQDPALVMVDSLTGVVKAPDVYTWADLKEEELRFKKEQRTIQNPQLKVLYENAQQSLYDEKRKAVYGMRIGDKRYGQALTPEQRTRVDTLLKQSTMGNKLSYSAASKYGLMKLVKAVDKAYAQKDLSAKDKSRLNMFSKAMEKYLVKLQEAQEKRLRAAISAVKASPDTKMQGKIYKALTKEGDLPSSTTERLDQKVSGGSIRYIQ